MKMKKEKKMKVVYLAAFGKGSDLGAREDK